MSHKSVVFQNFTTSKARASTEGRQIGHRNFQIISRLHFQVPCHPLYPQMSRSVLLLCKMIENTQYFVQICQKEVQRTGRPWAPTTVLLVHVPYYFGAYSKCLWCEIGRFIHEFSFCSHVALNLLCSMEEIKVSDIVWKWLSYYFKMLRLEGEHFAAVYLGLMYVSIYNWYIL